MRGLLDRFREREVARVDLYASAEGQPLYRELGFVNHPDPRHDPSRRHTR
jgi:hypothetical protein